jgi:hypothetical protein
MRIDWRRMSLLTVLALVSACAERAPEADSADTLPDSRPQAAGTDTVATATWTDEDWRILEEKVRWATDQRLDTVPIGEAIGRLGATFVGTTYTPGTLEQPGPERLVINLRELDCVTFVESVLALTWLIRNEGAEILAQQGRAKRRFEHYLTSLRYREGELDGYPSRLHYFSEWLADNEAKGLLTIRTRDLGGVPDAEPIDFMSTHRGSYAALADSTFFEEIRRAEQRLNARGPRIFIPKAQIAARASEIRTGDVIAATSTVKGLDIAHTGFALWQNGQLHLMHAPLVGKNVEISELPLAQRIQGISGQDGIMVATPSEWPAGR